MNTNAMQLLKSSCQKHGPLCVGLDTDPSYIPQNIISAYQTPADAVLAYNRAIIDGITGTAGCCKVQEAYYEAMGLAGMSCFAQTLKSVRSAGLPVISDVKRGDIADTAKAYARAHFTGDFETDIITVNPYMGFDTLEPFIQLAEEYNKGVFVLLRTSNPGMTDIEKQPLASGGTVLDRVGACLLNIAERFGSANNASGCSPFGAVVGCTEESDARQLRTTYPGIFFLIPGYGAQGGAARIAATLLQETGGTVNSSRGILCAWKKDQQLEAKRADGQLTLNDIADAAARAAADAKNDLCNALKNL